MKQRYLLCALCVSGYIATSFCMEASNDNIQIVGIAERIKPFLKIVEDFSQDDLSKEENFKNPSRYPHIAALLSISSLIENKENYNQQNQVAAIKQVLEYMKSHHYDVNKDILKQTITDSIDLLSVSGITSTPYVEKWPLIEACLIQNIQIIELLLSFGANPQHKHIYYDKNRNAKKISALGIAKRFENEEMLMLLKKSQSSLIGTLKKKLKKK